MDVRETEEEMERRLSEAFGVSCLRYVVVERTRKLEMPVLTAPGRPELELSSMATLGLWQTELMGSQERQELVTICETEREGCREVLAAAAFRVMRTRQPIRPGAVFVNCLHDWYPKASVPHLYFVPAEQWDFPQLLPCKYGNFTLRYLEALPISEAERQHVEEHGRYSLEALFLGASANLWDLRRESVV